MKNYMYNQPFNELLYNYPFWAHYKKYTNSSICISLKQCIGEFSTLVL